MSPEQIERVKDLIATALAQPTAQRAAFLDEACPDDSAVHREVSSLLARDGVEAPILEQPILDLLRPDESASTRLAQLEAGQRVGAYQILEILDQGGMGTVALARREDDFKKVVALKVIRPDAVSEDTLSRFHNERQLLASLDHPNVARILDGGTTTDGRPYFVMEHIDGLRLDRYCEQQALDLRQRLDLFLRVCAAVQVAHQSLVVHRDLKPANILVTADGVPKLLDFGIAKRLDAATVATMTVGSVPLTLRYASPEQVDPSPERPITTASDIYSLGVILFQMLTGRLPYELDGNSFAGLVRAICESDPPAPSAVDGPWPRRLAGDLDSVVLKALRKDPRQRYGSAEQLADDLRRHLEDRPVRARRGGLAYRTGKFARRYRLRLAIAAIAVAGALAVTVLSTTMWLWADTERQRRVEVLEFMQGLFKQAQPDQARGEDLRALDVLKRGERDVGDLKDPISQAMLLDTLGDVFRSLGLYDLALSPRLKALAIRRQQHAGPHPELAKAMNDLASTYLYLRRFEEAEALYRESLAMKQSLLDPFWSFVGAPGHEEVDAAKTVSNLATALRGLRRYEEAEQLYRQALDLRIESFGPDSKDVAGTLRNFSILLEVVGRHEQAAEFAERALRIRLDQHGPEHQSTASAHYALARATHALGRQTQAEEHYRRAMEIRRQRLGADHAATATARVGLAALLLEGGDRGPAAALLDQALPFLHGDSDAPALAEAHSVLGAVRAGQGRGEEAETLLTDGWRRLVEIYGEAATRSRQAQRRLEAYR